MVYDPSYNSAVDNPPGSPLDSSQMTGYNLSPNSPPIAEPVDVRAHPARSLPNMAWKKSVKAR